MADRYGRKDAERCGRRLAEAVGKEKDFGKCWRRKNGIEAKVGCWRLDYNPVYGGAVIEEIHTVGGGITQPFGMMRRKPREFCDAVDMAIKAIDVAWKEGAKKRRG